jgi:electron transfer flavoprotein beta subunit
MLLAAAIQWADLRLEVDPLTGVARPDPGRRSHGLPDADAAALEVALVLAERWDGEVVAVTAGPAPAERALRAALAAGANRAVRVELSDDAPQAGIAAALAPVTAAATVVCCGAAGPDRASGAVPAYLAHRLGAAQALGLVSVEPGQPGELHALRRLDGGRRERVRLRAPAVVSVEGAAARLRRASLAGELAARSATVETVAPAPGPAMAGVRPGRSELLPLRPRPRVVPPPAGATATARIGALVSPVVNVARAEPEVLDPAAAADRLLEVLRDWGELA